MLLGDNGSMYFWDWRSGYNFQKLNSIAQPGSINSEAGIFALAFDRSGSRLVSAEADKTIKIYKEDENAVIPFQSNYFANNLINLSCNRHLMAVLFWWPVRMNNKYGCLSWQKIVFIFRPRRHIQRTGVRAFYERPSTKSVCIMFDICLNLWK